VTHWGLARFHGNKNKVYDDIEFVAGLLGPAKAGLGPAEAVSLERFLQDKCKLGDPRRTPYQKYDPHKRNLPYHASLGASPTSLPIYSVYVACATAEPQKNAPVRVQTAAALTNADNRLTSQAKHNVVQFRIGSQFHVDGPEYVARAGSASHNNIFPFASYAEANKWLRARLKTDPNLGHKLAPESVKSRAALLTAVRIIPSKSPRLTKPYAGLFDFSVRTIE
jgi:hypothetical protein